MKILTSKQIREVDAATISLEGIPSLELMERAAAAFYHWFITRYASKDIAVALFAGTGNNGGDALAIARLLNQAGYPVHVFVVEYSSTYSDDCRENLHRVKAENISCDMISSTDEIPSLDPYDLLIDGIFGTGLNRAMSDLAKGVIQQINESKKKVISIDVPSGLFLDRPTPHAVHALGTVTFQVPKLALYLPENQPYTGEVWHVDIGLSEAAIAAMETDFFFTGINEARSMLKPLPRFAHKGMLGHALIIGGSLGMSGSVCLAAKGALKAGCGLVTAFLPKCGIPVIQGSFPEAMAIGDAHEERITSIEYSIQPDAIGIGVGMGQHPGTVQALHDFLKRYSRQEKRIPLVVDADGLNILAKHTDWLSLLPKETILTPHPKELHRLIGEWSNDFDKIQKTRTFAKAHGVIVLVKGAYTLIVDGDSVHVNNSGSPALATAGSGDVLTGIIASLLAQGYPPLNAARLGAFLHGYTANVSRGHIHERAFVASNIIENISNAYFALTSGY